MTGFNSKADTYVREELAREGWELGYIISPNYNSRPGRCQPDTIVVHYTALPLAASLVHLTSEQTQVSTHFIIDRDGSIIQLVPVAFRAWHAGVSSLRTRQDVNSFSVGLDLVFVPPDHDHYTDQQYGAMSVLTRILVETLDIRPENIVGHEHIALPHGRKQDPGPAFDWKRLYREIGASGTPPPVLAPSSPADSASRHL